jgi:DNA-binding CsgD family transcriptional regulator
MAQELVRSAGRARSRAGIAGAAAFLTRAAELTPDPGERVERSLDAASANVEAGAFDVARALLAMAEGLAHEGHRARMELVGAKLAFASNRRSDAAQLLFAAARRLEGLDIDASHETYLDAFTAVLLGARLAGGVAVQDVARAARAAPRRSASDPTPVDLLLDAFSALILDDDDTAVPVGRAALDRICGGRRAPDADLHWLWHVTILAHELLDDDNAVFSSQQHLEIARRTGALSELSLALSSGIGLQVLCGDLSTAASMVAEATSVQGAIGISAAPYAAMLLAVWHGEDRGARELIEATTSEAASRGDEPGLATCEYARAVLCNSQGRYEDAFEAAQRASDRRVLVLENRTLGELVESAARIGRDDVASDALHRLGRRARARGTRWALGVEARSRALLSDRSVAEGAFGHAIEQLSQTRMRAELARAHLLYGEWLRRLNRRLDARRELTVAHELFSTMGAKGFAERAHRELRASGATVRRRTVEARDDLTAQEAQVARLARDGWSNSEIGAQLFISARTVEWHLRKVFTKLDISSRRQLRVALPEGRPSVAIT